MKIATILTVATGLTLALGSAAVQAQAKPATPPATVNKPPTRVRTQLSGFELSPNSGKSANQVGGASRDIGTPRLYAPIVGKAFLRNPTFFWGTADPGSKVTFRLTSLDGQTVFETSTTASQLTYPADAPPLQAGATYRWTVIPENDMLGGAPQPVSIMIVSGEERTAILAELKQDPDPAGADVFMKHRIWYEAVAGYTSRLLRNPDDQDARKARATLYDQLPVTQELADADWRLVRQP